MPTADTALLTRKDRGLVGPRHTLGSAWMVVPMAAWMVVFFLIPLVFILLYSFGYQGVYDNTVSLGLHTENYRRIITDPLIWKAAFRTATFVVGNTLGCLILGFPLAYYMSRKAGRRKTLFLLLVMVPFWTSFLIRTYSWITILGDEGLAYSFLRAIGIVDSPLTILFTTKSVLLGLIYGYLPLMVLPLFVSLEKIDKSLFEASADLGAGKWHTFRSVTLPLCKPGILAGCLLVAIPTTGEFVVVSILGGDKVVVWGWLIYQYFTSYHDWAMGSALSNVLLVVMLAVIIAYVKLLGSEEF